MKTVVVHSGGLDSTVLLYWAMSTGEALPVSVNYGQRHARELVAAERICMRIGQRRIEIELSSIGPLLKGSSQTDRAIDVPNGHYADETMKTTVVPNRNMLLLAAAGAVAIAEKADALVYGAHAGDHAIYPDCRPEFVQAMTAAMKLADWHSLQLVAPFVDKTKAQIVRLGHELGVPFEMTWSCYREGDLHCGKCGTCVERREAFVLAGVADPTVYA